MAGWMDENRLMAA